MWDTMKVGKSVIWDSFHGSMVFVFSSQRILKPLDINCQDISVNRDTMVVLRSSRTGSGGGLAMFGGRPAGPKTVVFCVLPQLEAITVGSGRPQIFLYMQQRKLIWGKGHQFVQCSFKLQPSTITYRSRTVRGHARKPIF